jgi:hypothetical protein
MHFMTYSVPEKLVFRAGEPLFLSPVMIKLLSSAKYMGNIVLTNVRS